MLVNPEPETPTGLNGVPVPMGTPPLAPVYHSTVPQTTPEIVPGPETFHW